MEPEVTRAALERSIARGERELSARKTLLGTLLLGEMRAIRHPITSCAKTWRADLDSVRSGRTVLYTHRGADAARFGALPALRGRVTIPANARAYPVGTTRRDPRFLLDFIREGEPVVLTFDGAPMGVLVPILEVA